VIEYLGTVSLPPEAVEYADKIKFENYRTNTPAKFQVRCLMGCEHLMKDLSALVNIDRKYLDFVYFSCCKGAEPHTDKLNPAKFEDITYVVPIIVPKGRSVVVADTHEMEVSLGGVYRFNHTKTHALYLDDTESGCVVIMVGILKPDWIKEQP
jgi:hypothetical protein